MIKLYAMDIRVLPDNLTTLLPQLNEARRQSVARALRLDDKKRCVAAGLLLNEIFGTSDVEYTVNAYGKPSIVGKHDFSLSHSENYCILAVCDTGEVGIDIQIQRDTNYVGIAKVSFHELECQLLNDASDTRKTFYDIWTLKESVMKADGRGFFMRPKSFYVQFDKDSDEYTYSPAVSSDYPIAKLTMIRNLPGYSIAVCANEAVSDTKILFICP